MRFSAGCEGFLCSPVDILSLDDFVRDNMDVERKWTRIGEMGKNEMKIKERKKEMKKQEENGRLNNINSYDQS